MQPDGGPVRGAGAIAAAKRGHHPFFFGKRKRGVQARSQGIRKGGYVLRGVWGSSPRKFLNLGGEYLKI